MSSYTAHALRELQVLTASIVCPELPLTEELNEGAPLTIEHVNTLTDTLSRIAGRDVAKDIQTALESARDAYQAASGDTNSN
ncbi:hypothetical protein QP923_07680 [Corynebacterium sp. MSK151]|uniref:hypothetical protein n=1 Tax=unclassified Corynebacterium TaxID=2624378 RepID=UPI00254E4233|nr:MULTISPECIES: hypothetical protein [unclassified Corynebacterium]MDK8759475.1 hypothetical protein [Corynebacterium sp. MSK151]MDK8847516.1 hypothetical protein [Corynebacterium sp. MSK047]